MLGNQPFGSAARGSSEEIEYEEPPPPPPEGDIDATRIPASRTVVFEGSLRVVIFEGQ